MSKLELAILAREYISQTSHGIIDFRENELILLPTVFPPETNTPLLAELVEELASEFLSKNSQCRVFEMGIGTGAAILSVAKIKGVVATGSDISPMAVLNAKANALWWGVQCDIYQGNLFENVPPGEFDIIFWNIPLLKQDPGGIDHVRFKAAFDPDYKSLTKFLADANHRLAKNGHILLAIDYDMCDLDTIYQLIGEANFNWEVYREAKIAWKVEIMFAFLLLKKK